MPYPLEQVLSLCGRRGPYVLDRCFKLSSDKKRELRNKKCSKKQRHMHRGKSKPDSTAVPETSCIPCACVNWYKYNIEMLCRCSYNSDIVDLGRKSRDGSGKKKGSYETVKVKKVRNSSTECTLYNALYTNSYTKLPPPIRLPPHSLGVNQDRVHRRLWLGLLNLMSFTRERFN